MSTPDYYEVLDLLPSAGPDMVRVAYRTKAKSLHPDRGADSDAMALLNEAYETLRDPERRGEYDRARASEVPEPAEAAGDNSPPWGADEAFADSPDWGDDVAWADVEEPAPAQQPAEAAPVYPWEAGADPQAWPSPTGNPAPWPTYAPAHAAPKRWQRLPKNEPTARPARITTLVSVCITVAITLLPLVGGLIDGTGPNWDGVLFYVILGGVSFSAARFRVSGFQAAAGGYLAFVIILGIVTAMMTVASPLAGLLTLVWTVPFVTMVELRNRYFRPNVA